MAGRNHDTRQKLTFRLPPVKPRNPLAAAAMKRVAGPHRQSESARRSAERAALRKAAVDKDDDV